MTFNSDRAADIDVALDRLHLAIDQLEALISSDTQRVELDALRRAALRLGGAKLQSEGQPPKPAAATGIKQFEPARFQRLLQLAGPENGAELLARLSEDLIATRNQSSTSMASMEWSGLRAASHVLISLAGSVGAVSLQTLAERMNAAAHATDRTTVAALMPEALGELDALIAVVAATRPIGAAR
ncbi:hypothetical protein [Tabrizicola sp. BL-A-41-H6]|uniref:hypothetical protein n=1 Tax=Tabrizicola sp. BL-A-41-H6 TaxID=3421107 RepID=UPI003D6694EF